MTITEIQRKYNLSYGRAKQIWDLEQERDRAVNEVTTCRALLDSYGFQQTGIHNGITAMQSRILNLESLLKSYD